MKIFMEFSHQTFNIKLWLACSKVARPTVFKCGFPNHLAQVNTQNKKSPKPSFRNNLHSSPQGSNIHCLLTIPGVAAECDWWFIKPFLQFWHFSETSRVWTSIWCYLPPVPTLPQSPPLSLSPGVTLWSELFRERAGTHKINAFPGHIIARRQLA